jgi:hypothetical protein
LAEFARLRTMYFQESAENIENIENTVVEALKQFVPQLMYSDKWATLPATMRCKFMESYVFTGNNVPKTVPEETESPSPSNQEASNSKLIMRYLPIISNLDMSLKVTHSTKVYNRNKRNIMLHNDGSVRLAYRIETGIPSRTFYATPASGFIMPGARVIVTIAFNVFKKTVKVFYQESVQQYTQCCFMDNSCCKVKSIDL